MSDCANRLSRRVIIQGSNTDKVPRAADSLRLLNAIKVEIMNWIVLRLFCAAFKRAGYVGKCLGVVLKLKKNLQRVLQRALAVRAHTCCCGASYLSLTPK